MIHHNFENRYSGISLVSLGDLKWKKKTTQKQHQNFYEMLPREGSMTNSEVCQGSCIFPEKDDKTRGK